MGDPILFLKCMFYISNIILLIFIDLYIIHNLYLTQILHIEEKKITLTKESKILPSLVYYPFFDAAINYLNLFFYLQVVHIS